MNTLTSKLLAPLLSRLFQEAAASSVADSGAVADLSPQDLARMMRSKTDYRALYARLKDHALPVSPETGALLYMLARSNGARHIVEFGTSFGISTLHLAEGGLADLVEIREGDALQTLATELPESVDLLLLDGAKSLYPEVLALVAGRLRPGAFVIADNAGHNPEYLAHVRAPANGYLSTPVTDDVELSMRLG